MFFIGIGTAAPEQRYTQLQCWEALQASRQFNDLAPRSRAVLRKVLTGNNGIETRHLAFDDLSEAFDLTPDAMHQRFFRNGPAIAEQAARGALEDAEIQPEQIDAIIISTCTGYLCPGLTSYVSERLALRPDVLTLDLVGQGCGAALPNFRAAESLLTAGRCENILSICVEVCSAAFYLDDDVGVLISACLFGDGAGAAVLSNQPGRGRTVKWKTSQSLLQPQDRELLRFEQRCGMLRNILAPQVPEVAAQHVEKVFRETLEREQVGSSEISGWILHPGGRDVLNAVRTRLNLDADKVHWSEAVLREYGNVSSPSVYFILKNSIDDSIPDGLWWMTSFGAGFSCHGALLEVSGEANSARGNSASKS